MTLTLTQISKEVSFAFALREREREREIRSILERRGKGVWEVLGRWYVSVPETVPRIRSGLRFWKLFVFFFLFGACHYGRFTTYMAAFDFAKGGCIGFFFFFFKVGYSMRARSTSDFSVRTLLINFLIFFLPSSPSPLLDFQLLFGFSLWESQGRHGDWNQWQWRPHIPTMNTPPTLAVFRLGLELGLELGFGSCGLLWFELSAVSCRCFYRATRGGKWDPVRFGSVRSWPRRHITVF